MADWPVRGQASPDYWDDDVKAYIDEAVQAVADSATGLSGRVDALEALLPLLGFARSPDDSFDLPVPTDEGLEFVIVADALDEIRYDGVSL